MAFELRLAGHLAQPGVAMHTGAIICLNRGLRDAVDYVKRLCELFKTVFTEHVHVAQFFPAMESDTKVEERPALIRAEA